MKNFTYKLEPHAGSVYGEGVYKMSVILQKKLSDLYGIGFRINFVRTRIELKDYKLTGEKSGGLISAARVRNGRVSDEIVFGESVKGEGKAVIGAGNIADFYIKFKDSPAGPTDPANIKIQFREFLVARTERVADTTVIGGVKTSKLTSVYLGDDEQDDLENSDLQMIADQAGSHGFFTGTLAQNGFDGAGFANIFGINLPGGLARTGFFWVLTLTVLLTALCYKIWRIYMKKRTKSG